MDNISLQAEELEALTSIFWDQWKFNSEVNSYNIKLSKDIELWITLIDDYPSEKPPIYELLAPNLSRNKKNLIDTCFQEIFEMNKGYPVIYQWIEKLKEIAFDNSLNLKADVSKKKGNNFETGKFLNNSCKFTKPEKEKLDIVHGPPIIDRRSTFQGHACIVTDQNQIQEFLNEIHKNKKISQAKHNVLAYRIQTEKKGLLSDYDDDGESLAGGRLLHLLEMLDLKNVAVVVTRWYGGILLGSDRFKHYNNAARHALANAGISN